MDFCHTFRMANYIVLQPKFQDRHVLDRRFPKNIHHVLQLQATCQKQHKDLASQEALRMSRMPHAMVYYS